MESITTENKSVTGERAVSRQAKKRKNSSALILSACAVLLLGGVGAYYISSPWESTDDAFVAGHIVAVSPKVSGHIARVLVTDNESVKQGQVLAEIDNRDYKVALQKAEAKLLGAKARLTQTKTDLARYQALAVKDEISRQILDHGLQRGRYSARMERPSPVRNHGKRNRRTRAFKIPPERAALRVYAPWLPAG